MTRSLKIQPAKPLKRLSKASLSPATVYLDTLGSELSRRTLISPLNRAAHIIKPALMGDAAWREVPWEKLTAAAVRVIMADIKGSPATRNKALAALKGVARTAWELHLLDTEELMRIKSIKGDAGTREPAGRYVPTGEISALLKACAKDGSPSGARDSALMALAVGTGARRAELASIRMENVTAENADGVVTIRIIGKRNKERTLFVTGNARRTLDDWLATRGAAGCTTGALFCAIRKGGHVQPERQITPTALDVILRKRSAAAGLADLGWHDLRRTTASNLLDAGADITTVAGILGHSSVQTTARYDRRGERAKVKASELLSVPYFPRPRTPSLTTPETPTHE